MSDKRRSESQSSFKLELATEMAKESLNATEAPVWQLSLDTSHIFHLQCLFEWFRSNDRCHVCNLAITKEVTSQQTLDLLRLASCPQIKLLLKLIDEADSHSSAEIYWEEPRMTASANHQVVNH